MSETYKLRVNTNGEQLRIRSGPSLKYSVIGYLDNNQEITATKYENGWYYNNGDGTECAGWSCGTYLELISTSGTNITSSKITIESNQNSSDTNYTYNWSNSQIQSMMTNTITLTDDISMLRGVWGLPHQFIPNVDYRAETSSGGKSFYGTAFLESIIKDGTFVFITPGVASYMTGFSESDKESVLKQLLSMGSTEDSALEIVNDALTGKDGNYYTFEENYVDYMNYVNTMCRLSAVELGLKYVEGITGKPYGNYDWSDAGGSGAFGYSSGENFIYDEMSGLQGVCFFADGPSSSYSESSSNSTKESLLSSIASEGSDIGEELQFFGMTIGKTSIDSSTEDSSLNNYESKIKSLLSGLTFSGGAGIGGLLGQLKSYISTVFSGGQVLIPEIWSNSSYGTSYSLAFKFVAPYGVKESIYLDNLVPLFFLIGFSLPRQLGRAGYMSPFLIRAYSRGWFNCDMGIVSSFSVSKAPNAQWSKDGLPLEIDVDISIHDMYSAMAVGSDKNLGFMENQQFMDHISMLSGINMNKPDIIRRVEIAETFLADNILDFPRDTFEIFQQWIRNNLNRGLNLDFL